VTATGALRATEADEIDREDARVLREHVRRGHPVQVTATEAVHEDDRRASGPRVDGGIVGVGDGAAVCWRKRAMFEGRASGCDDDWVLRTTVSLRIFYLRIESKESSTRR